MAVINRACTSSRSSSHTPVGVVLGSGGKHTHAGAGQHGSGHRDRRVGPAEAQGNKGQRAGKQPEGLPLLLPVVLLLLSSSHRTSSSAGAAIAATGQQCRLRCCKQRRARRLQGRPQTHHPEHSVAAAICAAWAGIRSKMSGPEPGCASLRSRGLHTTHKRKQNASLRAHYREQVQRV